MLLYYILAVGLSLPLATLNSQHQSSDSDTMSIHDILPAGSPAPEFTLPDQNGTLVSLKDFAGKFVVLYFYPKDNTPGCTKESCDFRDNHSVFKELGAVVLGMSPDSAASHIKFITGHSLPFTLLSDTGKETLNRYGVWGKKSFAGKTYDGVIRTTVLIDPYGKIVKVWSPVSVDGHSLYVLNELKNAVNKHKK